MQCGPIRYQASKQLPQQSAISRILVPRFTAYRHLSEDPITFPRLTDFLITDEARNQLIVTDVCKALAEGRTPIILTSRTSHVDILSQLLSDCCQHVIPLIGSASAREKRLTMERLQAVPADESLVIVATGKYVGEGFDFPRLDTLMLTIPVSWKGIVEQYAGRLHRDYPNKQEVRIYDYVDIHVPLCELMYRRRIKGYAGIGYKPKSQPIDRGLFAELEEPDTQSTFFDGKSFVTVFKKDIANAKRSIVIAIPNNQSQVTGSLNRVLTDVAARGVEVVIKPTHSCRCAIIDKKLIWYGSINYLGRNTLNDNAMRFEEPNIASELLDIVYDS